MVPSVMDMIRSSTDAELPWFFKKKRGNWIWTPSTTCQIKVNFDSSFSDGSGRGGIGDVFKDSEGKVFLQLTKEGRVD